MAGPISNAWNWMNTPLVPQSQTVDKLAQPGLEDSPAWARVKGFGSGALEGLRQQTSPMGLVGLASLATRGGAEKAAEAVKGLAGVVPDLVESPAIRQAMPAAGDVDALIGGMKHTLAKIPSAGSRAQGAMQGLQRLPAEFVPRGAEQAYNAAAPAMQRTVLDPMESVYRRLMATRGGSQTGEVTPEALIGTAGGLGLAGLAGKKLYDMAQDPEINPLKRFSNIASGMKK